MKQLTCEARLDNLYRVTEFIDRELEALDCPLRAQSQLDVAVDEIFSNICRYAYAPGTGEAAVQFAFDPETREVSLTFLDRGTPYDPLQREDPDVSLSAEERGEGGLGVFLVKKLMDAVAYRYADGQNQLCMKKKI
ncbi:MAG: ATP-binding protein [Clostridia bacterium]|nr:ATP-binding protein [Clostridia bacterium]